MLTLATLRDLAGRLPDGAALTLPKAVLLEALGSGASAAATPPADLTVAEFAARFHRSPSTIRGWLGAGRVPGAYKLSGRDWRVPPAAVEAFLARERARYEAPAADLGAWRARRGRA